MAKPQECVAKKVKGHICPAWVAPILDNPLRRWLFKTHRLAKTFVRPGMTVADIGCGSGPISIEMARIVGDEGLVICVDVQQKMLDLLAKKAMKLDLTGRIRPHLCQPDDIGIVENTVDFALAHWAMHEAPNTAAMLYQVAKCLKPEGRFLVMEPLFHVSSKAFERLIAEAEGVGMELLEKPRFRFSRAALLGTSKDTKP